MCQGAQQEEAGEREVVVGCAMGEMGPSKVAGLWLHFSNLSASPADKKMCSQSITGWFLLRGANGGSAGTVAAMPASFWNKGGSKHLTCDSTCSRLATRQHLIPLSEGEMPFTHRAGLQAGSGGEEAAQSPPPPSSLRVSKAPVRASCPTHSR